MPESTQISPAPDFKVFGVLEGKPTAGGKLPLDGLAGPFTCPGPNPESVQLETNRVTAGKDRQPLAELMQLLHPDNNGWIDWPPTMDICDPC